MYDCTIKKQGSCRAGNATVPLGNSKQPRVSDFGKFTRGKEKVPRTRVAELVLKIICQKARCKWRVSVLFQRNRAVVFPEVAAVAQIWFLPGCEGSESSSLPREPCWVLAYHLELSLCILPLPPLWGALNYEAVPCSHNSSIYFFLSDWSVRY